MGRPLDRELSSEASPVLRCLPVSCKALFLSPICYLRKQRAPASTKKISLLSKRKGKKRSKAVCMSMAGVLHYCCCKLAVLDSGQAGIKKWLKW